MPDRGQEIIESLRRAYEAFSRGDFDTAIEIAPPLPGEDTEAFEAAGLSE